MAVTKPEIEWVLNPSKYFVEYGLMCLAGKWAVIKAKDFNRDDYQFMTDWVDDKKTAIGFLKLLIEE